MATDATGTPTPLGIPTYNVEDDAPSGNGFNAAMSVIDTLIGERAPVASPSFSGTPLAPTPTTGDNSTKIATTAFVKAQGYVTGSPVASVFGRTGAVVANSGDYLVSQVTGAAPIDSPTFTTAASAPTPATGDNSTAIATTAFVKAQGYLTAANGVSSFKGRVGAVVPASGDYTAAQVTNAADKSTSTIQQFTGEVGATSFVMAQQTASALNFTLSPDIPTAAYWTGTATAGGGTSTVNTPTNVPANSAILFIEGRNTGGSTTTMSWSAAFVGNNNTALPASIAAGGRFLVMFAWDNTDNKWRLIGSY